MYFTPKMFKYLKDLRANNNRDWFQANKHRYENEVKGPMLRFIAEFGSRLGKISPHFLADPRPTGGSLFRIYKDVRFSKDKSPYKTHTAAHFPHTRAGKDVHAPGFYLQISPSESSGGGGVWHPGVDSLAKIRESIVEKSTEWKKIRARNLVLLGDSLKRPPRGYDREHPFIEDLKRKDFFLMHAFTESEVCSSEFMDLFFESCKEARPLVRFLTNALDLEWK